MTDDAPRPELGPLHPVTRLRRVLQQVRSFTAMHAAELDGIADELEVAGQAELATRLRTYRDLHVQEAGLILDELADVRTDLEPEAGGTTPTTPEPMGQPGPISSPLPADPAANSPKRARWLAEQAQRAQRPVSRRDLFTGPRDQS